MHWSGLLPQSDNESWTWGLVPTLTDANRFWAVPSLTTVVALAVLLALSLRPGRRVPTVVTAVALLVAAGVGTVGAPPSCRGASWARADVAAPQAKASAAINTDFMQAKKSQTGQ